jgi:hypothetical protein
LLLEWPEQRLKADVWGRKKLTSPVSSICEALLNSSSIAEAAKSLGFGRAYIHQELAKVETTPQAITNGSLEIGHDLPLTDRRCTRVSNDISFDSEK